MKRALAVDGANGIGLSIAIELSKRNDIEKIYIVDKATVPEEYIGGKIYSYYFDLTNTDYSIFENFKDIDNSRFW